MTKIISETRQHLPIENETFTSKYEISIGDFLDKAPTDILTQLYQAIENELTTRYKNTIHFKETVFNDKANYLGRK